MNNPLYALALVRQSRLFRPFLDTTLAATALAAFAHLFAGFQPAEVKQTSVRPPAVAQLKQTQPQFLESRHASEGDLWKAWAEWIATSKPETGHCRFERVEHAGENLFHLLCFGTVGGHPVPLEVPLEALIEKRLFSVDDRRSRATARLRNKVNETPGKEAKPIYPIRGWVDTNTGRRHYNPEKRNWQAAP